jgi:cell wall-associated NlpC family hydrolase
VPKPDQLLLPASIVGMVAGAALFVGSATATSAGPPALRTAAFVGDAPPATTTTITGPVVTAAAPAPAEPEPVAPTIPPAEPEPVAPEKIATPSPVERVVAYALAQRGRPYRRGAAGPAAFDCSGLTSAAYAVVGVDLPRYSVTQAGLGRAVDWRHDGIEPGDLVFTRGDNPVIDLGHVGLAISATEWVVASRPGVPVRVEPLPAGIQRVRRLL